LGSRGRKHPGDDNIQAWSWGELPKWNGSEGQLNWGNQGTIGLGPGKVTQNNGKNSHMCKTELSFQTENLKSLWGTICKWISSSHRMYGSRIWGNINSQDTVLGFRFIAMTMNDNDDI